MVVSYRRFGTAFRLHLPGSNPWRWDQYATQKRLLETTILRRGKSQKCANLLRAKQCISVMFMSEGEGYSVRKFLQCLVSFVCYVLPIVVGV